MPSRAHAAAYATFARAAHDDPHAHVPPHPATTAWWGARLSLSWVSPLMALGHRKQLDADDVWPLQPHRRTKRLSAKFMKDFDASHSIVRASMKSFGWTLAYLVALFSSLAGPFVLNHVVSSLTSGTFSMEDVSKWVSGLFSLQVLQAVLDNYGDFLSELIAIEFVGCLKSLLYAKTMRLSVQSRMEKSTGDITNMYTSDSEAIIDVGYYIHQWWLMPLQIGIVSYMLYSVLSVAAFAGIGIIIVMLAINQFISKRMYGEQRVYRSSKDVRMKQVTEVFKAINIVKYNAWEDKFLVRIGQARAKELGDLFSFRVYSAADTVLLWGMPVFISIASFGTYSVLLKRELTPATVFTSLALFQMIEGPLRYITDMIAIVIQAKVALERVSEFLEMPEIDDGSVMSANDPLARDYIQNNVIVAIERANLGWDPQTTVLRDLNLHVRVGEFYVVHGTVGCGKSSFCSALLGEMIELSGFVYVGGTIAYCSQQPWIQNMTVRDNILFGHSFVRKKNAKILDACALTKDLDTLEAGDMTEIGERGVNLSGGQKPRFALVRACYSDASIYILDSPLSAVDAIVQNEIFQKCLLSLLRDKTIILVTHNPEIIASEHVTHAVTIDETDTLAETRKSLSRPQYESLVSPLLAHKFTNHSYGTTIDSADRLSAFEEVSQLNKEMALMSPFNASASKTFGVADIVTADGSAEQTALAPSPPVQRNQGSVLGGMSLWHTTVLWADLLSYLPSSWRKCCGKSSKYRATSGWAVGRATASHARRLVHHRRYRQHTTSACTRRSVSD